MPGQLTISKIISRQFGLDCMTVVEVVQVQGRIYFISKAFYCYNSCSVVKILILLYLTILSGFEHVFIGEIKNGEVSGFHDWVNFYQQEKTNAINYLGYIEKATINEV